MLRLHVSFFLFFLFYLCYYLYDKGRRAYYNTGLYPYKKYNCLCAIKYGKVVGVKIYEETGGINKEKFISFINEFIENKYKNHIILLDNAIFHKSKEVKTKIEETENNYLLFFFNSLYSSSQITIKLYPFSLMSFSLSMVCLYNSPYFFLLIGLISSGL